jgi:RNA polymerase sigma factor (sigma-70 family)
MATNRLRKALGHLQLALAPPEGDGVLLARFVAGREEAAFAALVRRHGPMVLGVCRRVLRHAHDADDAFQATFLVLAHKAASVLKREALGNWLYGVAYRTAQKLRSNQARRHAREKPMDDLPHPEVWPAEAQDWRPLLDQELSRLPEKYRAVVVLCDLQGQSRREAARQLRLPDGTLTRRLAAGRKLLAARLSRRGVALAGGALAAALSGGAASAQVSAPLVLATARAAAGHLAAVAPAVAVLAQGVLRTMFLTKLKVVVGVVLVVVALGAGGIAYRPADAQTFQPPARAQGKPKNELEALRRENELLRLNLEVVLEKVRAQEQELRAVRGRPAEVRGFSNLRPGQAPALVDELKRANAPDLYWRALDGNNRPKGVSPPPADVVVRDRPLADVADRIEIALKRLLDAKDGPARERALGEFREALRALRAQPRQSPYYPQQDYVPKPK